MSTAGLKGDGSFWCEFPARVCVAAGPDCTVIRLRILAVRAGWQRSMSRCKDNMLLSFRLNRKAV